jgi:signal transduction histidine kinase
MKQPINIVPSSADLYKFSLLTILWFIISMFFYPVFDEVWTQDYVFYLNAISASLCLLLLLQDAWELNGKHEQIQRYLWYVVVFLSLPCISAFTVVRSGYSFPWIINFILANTLLWLTLRTASIFYIVCMSGVACGIVLGAVLNFYIPVVQPLDTYFASSSCIFLLLRIALIIHDRTYVEQHVYKLIEKEVQARTQDLREALEIKNEFLDNVSHEIKTPVHNITNIVSELHDQWKHISAKEKLEMIKLLQKSNTRLLSLCSNLLDLSKFTKGHDIEMKKCNITVLIEEVLMEYRNFAQLISIKLPPKGNRFVYCDKEKILQVLRNLLDNSIRYGNGSPVEISVNNEGENYTIFAVADEGVGIPENELSSIFNPFEQSSITKTKAGGTGLGLAICKKIIEYHHGKIWAENNSTKGVTFFFTLPNNLSI